MTYSFSSDSLTRPLLSVAAYLIDIKHFQPCFPYRILNQSSEIGENLCGQQLISRPIDRSPKVDSIGQAFNAECSASALAQRLLHCLRLKLQLRQTLGIRSWIRLVLFHKLLGEMVDQHLIQLRTA